MSPRIRPPRARAAAPAAALAILMLLAAAPPAGAQGPPQQIGMEGDQFEIGHLYVKPPPAATPIPFTDRDFIRLAGPVISSARVYHGEPIRFALRLVNHTDFKINAMTNFNPRANLKIYVRAEGRPERQIFGPYLQAIYTDMPFVLYPMEERTVHVMIWSERDAPSSLVFAAPGTYFVRFEIEMGAELSQVRGTMPALGPDLQPVAPIQVTVLPARPETAELVEELIELRAFPNLELTNMWFGGTHPALADALARLVQEHPGSPLTPYIDYALAMNDRRQAGAKLEDAELFQSIVYHLDRAATADSYYQTDAIADLARLLDLRGNAIQAKQVTEKLIEVASPEVRIRLGSFPLYRKYLINSAELSPAKYWTLLY